MPRRAAPLPDAADRLAQAVALHRDAMARLNARMRGQAYAPPPAPTSTPAPAPSITPEQAYLNTSRLLGEGSD